MILLAIDPGNIKSAFVYYDTEKKIILHKDILQNWEIIKSIDLNEEDQIVIEMIASYGMPVGKEVFETCVWIGRFIQAANIPESVELIYRKDEKMFLCGSMKAKDSNIRQALIDLLGKEKTKGCAKDIWSALAVAVTYAGGLKK